MTHKTFGETFRYPKLNKYEGLEGTIPLRYGDIFMGIEVEAEKSGSRRGVTCPGSFKSVTDGSLKVDGMEFVTVPIKLLYMEKELERLFGGIPNADFSTRTSIHVHMNARDFTVQNMLDFTILYTLFERSMYRYSGDRWNNNFCIPLQLAPNNIINLLKRFLGFSTELQQETVEGHGVTWSKYLGYNLSPLTGSGEGSSRYGTIEFRQMKGNNNIPYIIDWCNLITCLKFYARSVDSTELMQSVMENRSHLLAEEIFRQWTPLIIPNKESVEDIKKANTFLKYCMRKGNAGRSVPRAAELNRTDLADWGSITMAELTAPRSHGWEAVRDAVSAPQRVPMPRPSLRGRAIPPVQNGETYTEYMTRIRAIEENIVISDIATVVSDEVVTTRTPTVRIRRT